jgi:hypothetical protein
MYDSQTIQMTGTASTEVYSPWFPRGGDYGLFTLEVTAMGKNAGTLTLAVAMYHKNTSEAGDPALPAAGGVALTDFDLTAVGRVTVDFKNGYGSSPAFGGFKELVRYKFTLSGVSTTNTSWATFRMLSPVWYDAVSA